MNCAGEAKTSDKSPYRTFKDFEMNEDRLKELLKQVKVPLERDFLRKVYPRLKLTPDQAQELRPQYDINFIPELKTIPDFAFPDMKIAIYCDEYPLHRDEPAFSVDRFQSNELQSYGWIVFRWSEKQIGDNGFRNQIVREIKRAIAQRDERQQELDSVIAQRDKRQQELKSASQAAGRWKWATFALGIGLALSFVLILILFKSKGPPPIPVPLGDTVLIPAGEFQMGGSDSDAEIDEHPVHTVDVNAFYIHKYEVTNAQYKNFVDANPQWQKNSIPRKFHNGEYLKLWKDNTYPPGKENHPVVYVSWYAAMAYAKWGGRRLPTEAEWEKAARGGLVGAKYPWGDVIDDSMANYGGDFRDTQPVGSYSPNDYGLYDMTGNVMEWCLDAYDENFYNHSPSRSPIAGGPLVDIVNNFVSVTNPRVVRSGCWYNVPMHVRVADRYGTSPDDASGGRGFRCAGSVTVLSE